MRLPSFALALLLAASGSAQDDPEPRESEKQSEEKPKPRRRTRIMLPGDSAWKPPPAPPAPNTDPLNGDLFWTGRLAKNEVITIDGESASLGDLGGKFLPGKPVKLRTFSPQVQISRQPSAGDDYTSFAFRALRNSKGTVTINFRWTLDLK